MYKLKEHFKIPYQTGNKNKKKEITIQNQIEIQELKHTISEIKNTLKGPNRRTELIEGLAGFVIC